MSDKQKKSLNGHVSFVIVWICVVTLLILVILLFCMSVLESQVTFEGGVF